MGNDADISEIVTKTSDPEPVDISVAVYKKRNE